MKRLNLVSISSSNDEVEMNKSQKLAKQGYSREFQAMLDSLEEEDNYTDQEEAIHNNCSSSEKKRRLSTHQVKALEKNFEVENKLEPERKLKLAEELGLQPRQVAIWFQNRRARWKTKQLERDYTVLKANYDALQLDYTNLEQHNHSLTLQLKEVKAKIMGEEKAESSSHSVKEECPVSVSESDQNNVEVSDNNNCNSNSNGEINGENGYPLMNWIQLSESRTIMQVPLFQSQLVKLEEQSLFNINTEESCNFFSVDQPPTLHWQ